MNREANERKGFVLLLAGTSIAFAYIMWPYFGPVFWAIVLAILFNPVYRRVLARMPKRRSLAALATLFLCLVAVLVPFIALASAVLQEGAALYDKIAARQTDLASVLEAVMNVLPAWISRWLDRLGLGSISDIQERVAQGALEISQFLAPRVLNVGQNTLELFLNVGIMLYVLFFLLRDGAAALASVKNAVPLPPTQKQRLFGQFTSVIRATVKGNLVVAAVQGFLGGVMLWILGVEAALLWGAIMAFLSLLPAIGSPLVWLPIALYLMATGAMLKGIALIAYGTLVIGSADNVLRPLLVGKDIKMPDYLVLVSTLGGIAVFGLNGFVIGPVIAALFVTSWKLFAMAEQDVA